MLKRRAESLVNPESVKNYLGETDKATIALLGSAAVGKTSIVRQFLYNRFDNEHHATVEQMYHISDRNISLSILDTSGTYSFPAMRDLAIQKCDAFILVYAINDSESFENIRVLRNRIFELRPDEKIPIVVVGNKCDLEDSRAVVKSIAESVVSIDWEIRFVEASASEDVNIADIFRNVLFQVENRSSFLPLIERRLSLPAGQIRRNIIVQRQDSCTVQ